MNPNSTPNPLSRIPTLDRLGARAPDDIDVIKVANDWFQRFASYISAGDIDGILRLLCDDSLWRDLLALTWDMRTFDGADRIKAFLTNRLPPAKVEGLKLKDFVRLQKPYPDLVWIVGMFGFETNSGLCSGVFRLVPTANGEWKAYTVFTNLEDLKGYPEMIGSSRNFRAVSGKEWEEGRRKESAFEDSDPSVLIVGGGQSGLEVAARLKYLNIPTLIVEKDARIGDSWRNRYDTLCLHWPVCAYIYYRRLIPSFIDSFRV